MKRIGKLETPTQVRSEMVRVYKDMRNGNIKTADGSKLVYALNTVLGAVAVEAGASDGSSIVIRWEK